MQRKILLLLLPMLMLACKTLMPEPAAKQQPASAPTRTTLKTSTPRPTSATGETSNAPAQKGFTLVRLEPDDGDLPKLLAAEAQKAAALGQMPVVEFDAPW